MKHIDISSKKHPNTFTIVDDCDYDELNKYKWYANQNRKCLYAVRSSGSWPNQKTVRMHRDIMQPREHEQVDHKNRNGLYNRRCNLRVCTLTQNNRNKSIQRNNKSGFVGVSYCKRNEKYLASITYLGKVKFIAYCFCPFKAAGLRDIASKKLHKEFANLNNVNCNCLAALCVIKEQSND